MLESERESLIGGIVPGMHVGWSLTKQIDWNRMNGLESRPRIDQAKVQLAPHAEGTSTSTSAQTHRKESEGRVRVSQGSDLDHPHKGRNAEQETPAGGAKFSLVCCRTEWQQPIVTG
ncbi:hypothetical protein BO82DRAFT_185933 [Aspergillus uvarum CBS 121591]|uniref:Uncharacterized protein n=1 Tax=Aspergillus uvarum CBS 121591 TaxID=1448315 RepID=A0A319BYJ5_9EURO|nr:hypothetical protein BO82DRAFT_185933 [Aspergillus uvarum CBS 121591]PYH77271.1 hypothetical protein BO82DRAFT_185933 [Aspergillus uvarum CBS 121591]